MTETQQAQFERQTILQKIADELKYLEGIEIVYRSLLRRQTITALENQGDSLGSSRDLQSVAAPEDVQAIEDTKRKIASDITRRRSILQAIEFVLRTNFLVAMTKEQSALSKLLDEKSSPLLFNLLRQSPAHLQNSARLPLASLEDVITLFDAAELEEQQGSANYLPQAVLFYQLEVFHRDNYRDKSFPAPENSVDSAFIPPTV